MSTTIGPTTKRVKVSECPACKAYLWADVDIEVNVTEPEWCDGRAVVYASPHLTGMVVAHSCWIAHDGEWVRKDLLQLGDLGDVEQAWWEGHLDVCNDCNCPADANPYTRAAKGCDGDETAGEEMA